MRKLEPQLVDFIEQSGSNLNSISKASGLSNVYLGKLVQGGINRPGKDKVASIMLALNTTISEINQMLAAYDYQPLHKDDIPGILRNNRRRTIEGGNLPQYDNIYFDLLLVALERIGGSKVLVINRPSSVFMPSALYLMQEYPHEADSRAARFRFQLTEALLAERRKLFKSACEKGNRIDTYICKSCLDDFLDQHINPDARHKNPLRAELFVNYFANALSLAMKRPDIHRIFIMERCPYFHFLMQDANGDHPKVSYPGRKLHAFNNQYDKRMLEGFTTDLPAIVGLFKNEVEMCKGAVDETISGDYPQSLYNYLMDRFTNFNMAADLKDSLATLMQDPHLTFY